MTPNINGLSYTLNGANVEVTETLGYMVCVKLNAGDNKIVATYKYPYTLHWIVAFLACIIIVALLLWLYKNNKLKIFEKPIYYGMLAIFAVVVLVVYVTGSIFSVIAFFNLL